ncbi:transporter substrate-binding domain-containing protein [Nostoc sp. FACHB-110]|uniref:transporter substrate-binding domain-containing protein n=1 Tax=Nostoc sp. FACHB-110 TaxID=2692834 RepID=UPI001688E4CA|nr:transporter substrate-binding domain-containing protein [Nostoc sp. FACHB-110]
MVDAIAQKLNQFFAARKMKRFLKQHLWLGLVCGILVFLLVVHPAQSQQPAAQTTQPPLTVATRAIPPFVFVEKNELSGFSIELWRSIAKNIDAEFKFVEYPNVADLLSAVQNGKADAGIAAISITAERQQQFDFSLPMFTGGLQILVRDSKGSSGSTPNILSLFFSAALLQVIGLALLLIVVAAHIIWLSERNHKEGMIPQSYFPGIFKAGWWAAATLATQADEMPKGVIGRVLAIIWMFIGVLFVAYFTAAATTSLTVQQLQGDINSVDDLPGKVVATTTGSTAATYLKEHKISILEVPKIEQAYEALEAKKADAVVFDAPVLLYYAANQGQGKVEVVGSVFREENYGIVLPNNSPYRKSINRALLKLKEDGTYQALYDKWFSVKKS